MTMQIQSDIVTEIAMGSIPEAWLEGIGYGDTQCKDPLGKVTDNPPLYSTNGFEARNTKPPHPNGKPIPEVVKTIHGGVGYLTKPVEFFSYWSWGWRITSKTTRDFYWERHMRGDAGITNKNGIEECESYVLGTNVGKQDMRTEGVDMPRGNSYRLEHAIGKDDDLVDFWVLDYHWLAKLPAKTDADIEAIKTLAMKTPRWLLHNAWIIHSDGHATRWDMDFKFPLMCSELDQPTKIIRDVNPNNPNDFVDWHCRLNSIRRARVGMI